MKNIFILFSLFSINSYSGNIEFYYNQSDSLFFRAEYSNNLELDSICNSFEKNDIQGIHIYDEEATEIPFPVFKFKNLDYLDLVCENLVSVQAEIEELTKLGGINIESDKLMNIDKKIMNLPNLQYLHIGKMENLNSICYFSKIKNIQELIISFNFLESTGPYQQTKNSFKCISELKECKNLTYLVIRGLHFSQDDIDQLLLQFSNNGTEITIYDASNKYHADAISK